MAKPYASVGDYAIGHKGDQVMILTGSSKVYINGKAGATKQSIMAPHPLPDGSIHSTSISTYSTNVTFGGQPAVRIGDSLTCGILIAIGSQNVK